MTLSAASCIRVYKASPAASLRLFCFPYAGSSTSAFQALAAALPGEIEVCGFEYPGRGGRAKERPAASLSQMVQELAPCLEAYGDKPFAFFGYSMGALVCYELARTLVHRKRQPEHVFLAAVGAPRSTKPRALSRLPDAQFLAELKKLNGIPSEILNNAELLALALPVLRADFALCESYQAGEDEPLRCPLTVFGGQHDAHVPLGSLEAWSSYAGSSFSSRILPGGHFFLRTAQAAVVSALLEELRPLLRAPSPPESARSAPSPASTSAAPQDKRAVLARLLRTRLKGAASFPLSLAQQVLWFEQALDPSSAALHIPLVFQIRAELSLPGLTRALELLLDRHPLLRSVFIESPGQPLQQQPRAAAPVRLPVHQLTARGGEAEAAAIAAAAKQASARMDLQTGPLYRFAVMQASASEFFFLAAIHAIVLDRCSVAILQQEISRIYGAILRQSDPDLAPPSTSYEEFVEAEQRELNAGALHALREYWKQRSLDASGPLQLPGNDMPYKGASSRLRILPHALTGALQRAAAQGGSTLAAMMLSAYALLLSSTCSQGASHASGIRIETTCANRSRPQFADILGPFARTTPFSVDLRGDPTCLELVSRVHQALQRDCLHAATPLEQLGVLSGLGGNDSLRAGFSFQQKPDQHDSGQDSLRPSTPSNNAVPDPVTLISGAGTFTRSGLHLDVSSTTQGLLLLLEWNTESWSDEQCSQLLDGYVRLLQVIASRPVLRIRQAASAAAEAGDLSAQPHPYENWQPAC